MRRAERWGDECRCSQKSEDRFAHEVFLYAQILDCLRVKESVHRVRVLGMCAAKQRKGPLPPTAALAGWCEIAHMGRFGREPRIWVLCMSFRLRPVLWRR